jgi:large subunit ribosomal protein L17
MRHGNKINHLGRTTSHRHAMLSNMASSLIISKRIITTLAKAKELRKYIEPLVTKSKDDSTHSRRIVFSYLQNKDSVKELFGNIANKVADRPGGYTRILKTGNRLGDNAEMCMMEFVDFNELLNGGKLVVKETATAKRTRRGSAKKESTSSEPKAKPAAAQAAPVAETSEVEETPIIEDSIQEAEIVENANNLPEQESTDSDQEENKTEA